MWLLAAALALWCSSFMIPTCIFGAGGSPTGEQSHAAVDGHAASTVQEAAPCRYRCTRTWICPKFVLAPVATQTTACHGMLKGWLHTPQAGLAELSYLFHFKSDSVASVIKVLLTLLL